MIKILILVITGLLLAACVNSYMKSKKTEASDKSTDLDIVVIHEISPTEKNVKTLDQVFSWGREAMGEYFYYGETEQSAIKSDGTGDLSKAEYFAEVTVSFEPDVTNVAKSEARTFTSSSYARFDIAAQVGESKLGDLNPNQLSSRLKTPDYVSVISAENNRFQTFHSDGFFKTVYFRDVSIEQNRVREIKVWSKSENTNIAWLHSRFIDLVGKYETIPMNEYTGAVRQ